MVQWGPQPGARPQSQALGTRPPALGAGVASGFGTWESPAARIHCGRLDGHSWGRLDSHSWGLLEGHSWGPLDSHSWGPWTATAGAPGQSQLGPLEGHSWPWRNLRPGASRGWGQLGAGWLQACCCQCPYERTILATRPLAGGCCPVIQRLAGQ